MDSYSQDTKGFVIKDIDLRCRLRCCTAFTLVAAWHCGRWSSLPWPARPRPAIPARPAYSVPYMLPIQISCHLFLAEPAPARKEARCAHPHIPTGTGIGKGCKIYGESHLSCRLLAYFHGYTVGFMEDTTYFHLAMPCYRQMLTQRAIIPQDTPHS
jgi:hypothetical protein